jgi:hypothetical protein
MLHSLSRILTHFASRVSVISQTHPKGMQLTISVMPCPEKIKDEALRQSMIAPIVIVGNTDELESQLNEFINVQKVAEDNPVIESSVADYLASIAKASKEPSKAKEAKPTSTKQTSDKPVEQTPKASTPSVDDGLDSFFCE